MLLPTREWLPCSGLLAVLVVVGCGDSGGTAKNVGDMSNPKPTKPVDAGDAGEPPPSAATYREACEKSCKTQSECLQLSEAQCEQECRAQASALRSSCYAEATDEQACLETLSCDELKAYAIEGRRQHARCGEVAQAYFKACTLDGGRIPEACTSMCARYIECDASTVSQAACEESCALRVTAFHDDEKACGDAFLAFIGCSAQANCDEIKALAETDLSPVACNDALDAVDAACAL